MKWNEGYQNIQKMRCWVDISDSSINACLNGVQVFILTVISKCCKLPPWNNNKKAISKITIIHNNFSLNFDANKINDTQYLP